MKHDVAESYFELLTEQDGLPAKPFDPVEELKRLRRRLALRIQPHQLPEQKDNLPFLLPEMEARVLPLPPQTEPFALEMVVEKVGKIKKTLAIWQQSRLSRRTPLAIFRGNRQFWCKKRFPSVVEQYLTDPQEGTLETINAALTALGIIGVVFGLLSFSHGWASGLSFGLQVSLSGLTVIAIGLGGRFLISRVDSAQP